MINSDIRSIKKQQGAVLVISLIMLLLMSVLAISSMSNTVVQERMAGNVVDKQRAFQAAEAALRDAERFIETTGINIEDVVFDNSASPESPLDYDVDNDGDNCLNGLCTPVNHTIGYSGATTSNACTDATYIPERWENCAAGTAAAGNNLNVWVTGSNKHRVYGSANMLDVAEEPRYIIEFMGYVHPDGTSPTNTCGHANDIIWPTNADSTEICNTQHLYRITALGFGRSLATQVMLQSTYIKTL